MNNGYVIDALANLTCCIFCHSTWKRMIFPWMGNPDAEIKNYTTSKLRRASQGMVKNVRSLCVLCRFLLLFVVTVKRLNSFSMFVVIQKRCLTFQESYSFLNRNSNRKNRKSRRFYHLLIEILWKYHKQAQ